VGRSKNPLPRQPKEKCSTLGMFDNAGIEINLKQDRLKIEEEPVQLSRPRDPLAKGNRRTSSDEAKRKGKGQRGRTSFASTIETKQYNNGKTMGRGM